MVAISSSKALKAESVTLPSLNSSEQSGPCHSRKNPETGATVAGGVDEAYSQEPLHLLIGHVQKLSAQYKSMTIPRENERPTSESAPQLAEAAQAQSATEDAELVGTDAFDAGLAEMPAWEDLVRQHADSVYRLAFRLSGNQQDAEDLTQETFMRVFRSLKHYKAGTFRGWLHRITTNLFLDMVRHRQTIRMEALPEDYERVPGNDMTPEQAYTVNNLTPVLQEALDNLSPDFRVAVVLCDVVGMSYEEIAGTLGVKMGTVRSRIHRGRAQMRTYLEAAAEASEDARLLIPANV